MKNLLFFFIFSSFFAFISTFYSENAYAAVQTSKKQNNISKTNKKENQPKIVKPVITPHIAIYKITLNSTKGGARAIVGASGILKYRIQKKCGNWTTETIFSLDLSSDLTGVETTNWKQTTTETLNGCYFDFSVFSRSKGVDHSELTGSSVCVGKTKQLTIDYPVFNTYNLPSKVKFPLQQLYSILTAALNNKTSLSSFVYDGTKENEYLKSIALIFKNKEKKSPFKGFPSLNYWNVIQSFYSVTPIISDTPLYQTSITYFDGGIANNIIQNFGEYSLKSELISLEAAPTLQCDEQK